MGKLSVLERIFGGLIMTPMAIAPNAGGATEFGGRTDLGSGQASVTLSTTMVHSDSLIMFGTECSSVGIVVGSHGYVCVNSIVDGVSFAFARSTNVGVPFDETVMWEIKRQS